MGSATTVSPVMNCGHGDYSYDRNSYYQRECANLQKGKIEEVIKEKLDVKKFSSTSNTIRIADLGCSIGPNTFMAMHNVVEAMKQKFHSQFGPSSKMPEFQVLFNDQPSNDFNTLFTSLPKERPYFPVGVPGSFHGRLFPESSTHFAYAAYALHWLSKVPEELLDNKSPAWNNGRVHYTNAPKEVVDAYKRQFFEDMNNFLNAREKEIVTGGMIVIILPSIRHEQPHSEIPMGFSSDSMASVLMDMVKEGLVDEKEANSFNLPMYAPSPEEITELIASNSCFSIEMMDTTNPAVIVNNGPVDVGELAAHYRAAFEELLTKHFNCGFNFVDDFFGRLTKKFIEGSARLHSTLPNSLQLLVILKRN